MHEHVGCFPGCYLVHALHLQAHRIVPTQKGRARRDILVTKNGGLRSELEKWLEVRGSMNGPAWYKALHLSYPWIILRAHRTCLFAVGVLWFDARGGRCFRRPPIFSAQCRQCILSCRKPTLWGTLLSVFSADRPEQVPVAPVGGGRRQQGVVPRFPAREGPEHWYSCDHHGLF